MKRLSSFFLTLVVCQLATAQTIKLTGIGRFKIGSTRINVIDSVCSELNAKVKLLDTQLQLETVQQALRSNVYQIPQNAPIANSYNCEYVKVFYLNKYTVAGIKLKNTYLTFYKDTLVQFKTDPTAEFADALHIKYGNPKPYLESKKVECSYYLTGRKVEVEETRNIQVWQTNEILGELIFNSYYDAKCYPQSTSYFQIRNLVAVKAINSCVEETARIYKPNPAIKPNKRLSEF